MDVSTLAAVEFHGKKRHSEAEVGTLLTMEGGLGRNFANGAAKVGLVYVAQGKLSDDTLTGLPASLVRGWSSHAHSVKDTLMTWVHCTVAISVAITPSR